jgi:hypothetical protein
MGRERLPFFFWGEARSTAGGYFEQIQGSVMRHSFEKLKNGFRRAFNAMIRQWGLTLF